MKCDKIRILQMTPPEINNGVYKYVFGYLPYLNPNEYEIGFLTRGYKDLLRTKEFKNYAFSVHPFVSTQRDNPYELENEVRDVLSRYDIIHLHTSSWRGFMIERIAMEMGLSKVIVHSHSTGIDVADTNERDRQINEHLHYRALFNESYGTNFCACSMAAADWLYGEAINRDKIQILPNAIDLKRYQYDEEKRQRIRHELGVEDRFVIGNVGRYSYQKNQDFLIRVLAKAHKSNPQLFLVCVGQGPEIERYKQIVKELDVSDVVMLLPWSDDVVDILQAMDLFCLPSLFEGFPISLVEAQVVGLRCLVSNRVTSEANVSQNVEYMPLDELCWVDRIQRTASQGPCVLDNYNRIKMSGYDIVDAVGKIKELYSD